MRKKLLYLGLAAALTVGATAVRPAVAATWVCTTTCDNPNCCSTCCTDGTRVICTANPCYSSN